MNSKTETKIALTLNKLAYFIRLKSKSSETKETAKEKGKENEEKKERDGWGNPVQFFLASLGYTGLLKFLNSIKTS